MARHGRGRWKHGEHGERHKKKGEKWQNKGEKWHKKAEEWHKKAEKLEEKLHRKAEKLAEKLHKKAEKWDQKAKVWDEKHKHNAAEDKVKAAEAAKAQAEKGMADAIKAQKVVEDTLSKENVKLDEVHTLKIQADNMKVLMTLDSETVIKLVQAAHDYHTAVSPNTFTDSMHELNEFVEAMYSNESAAVPVGGNSNAYYELATQLHDAGWVNLDG